MPKRKRIFVSYSRNDRVVVQPLIRALARAGMHIVDPHSRLHPPDNPCLKIGRALEDADAMLAIVSSNFSQSELCQEEVGFALTSGRYASRVVSVFLDQTIKPRPWFLSKLPHVSYSEDALALAKEIGDLLPGVSG